MLENTCNVCGANLIYKDGRWVCPACGAYKEEEISNEEVTLLYNASQKLRLASFDDAEELYADIVKKYPKNSEAHWGLVLSRYGIKYEDDYDGRKLPTCYAATMESFLSDKEYLAALSCAPDAKVKAYYEEQGKIIEKNRIEWYEKASKEPAYDVFLCFKDSDKENNIERTDDSIEVANLYTYLSGKGYRVFFSRETLRDKVAEKYEPCIYNALNTASVMIVYGSKPEYFESVWMKNEWTRFLKRMLEGLKVDGSLIVAYDGMNPAELPKVFAGRQCLDARKKTFYGDLETLIARVIAIAKRPKAAVERIEIKGVVGRKKTSVGTQIKTIQAGGAIGKKAPVAVNTGVATREIGQYEVPELTPDEETKTKTVFRFLSAGLFDNAQKVVEEILEKNHYNSRALFAKFLIHYEAKNETELAGKLSAVDDFEEIKAVIAYNDKSIGEKILSALAKQTMTFAENGDFDHAISYLREIGPYNSSAVTELKANLKPYTVSLLAEHPDTSEQLFAALLETYTDADSYIPYLQEYVNKCLQNNRLELAKKYNDKVVELDDGDLNATLISMYLSVSANCLADFIEKSDAFTEFAMLDSALRKFDADEVDGFFATMEKIISGLIGRQANGDAICRWFDFVTKYEFAGRQDLIRTTMAGLAELADCKKRSKLFDSILACIDSADVDQHITLRMEYAASMQGAGKFSLAEKYYKQVLDIEEGNCDAMFGRILCHCGAKSEQELPGTVDQFEDFKSFETLLRYCPDEENRCKYLGFVLSAISERSKGVTDKATIAHLAGVFDGIVKYYPEDRNKELLSYTMQFAANAKNSAVFETAEKYYAVALSIDHLCHEAYWGLLQAKLSCRNNDDLIHQKTLIGDMPEFSSAIAAAGDDDRSADRYVKLAKEQRDYIKKQKDKNAHHKKVRRRIVFASFATAIVLVAALSVFGFIRYRQTESGLKYGSTIGGYAVSGGKYYSDTVVELPDTVNGKALTTIAAKAFKDNLHIETVIIPSAVTTIEAEAFSGCTNLKTIVFKTKTRSEIITLSVSSMSGSIKTESGVISIGDRAFYGCENLSAMDLSSIRSIGENAFDGCKALAELTLSDQLTTVKAGAFSGCASLKTVYLPATVEYLGRAAFSGCVGLESVVFEERDGGIGTFDIAWREGMSDHTKVDIGFKLTLDYGKSTGNIGSKTVAVIRDGNFIMPVPVRAGYTFVGWFTAVTDGEQLTDAEGKSLKKYDEDEAIILYAVFEANANKVSFDANGGIGSMPEQTIHTDEIAKLVSNTFAKAGYAFVGWATAPDGKKVYNDTQSIEMGTESFTLYAVWEAKINTIRFDANGGSGEAFSQDIATDETRVLTKNTYTKNGYAFVGWATTPSGAIAYADQASYTMGTDASYTLYAVWELADYSISYDLNGGFGDGNPMTYNMLSDSFTLYSPTRPGYTFLGWSGTGIEGIRMTVTVETGSFGERSYTANWKANSNRIIFNANGGTGVMRDQSVDTDDTVALNANTFTNEGYVFTGWSTTPSGSVLYADKAQYTMGTESAYTLYAIWRIKGYTISYQLNQGTVSGNPSEYFKTTPTFTLKNPTRPGYTFLGWSGTGITGMSKTVTIAQGSVGDRTYTANWEANTNSIIFHANGGSGSMANQGMRTGESGKLSMNQFYATGCNFLGWATVQDGDVVYKDGATFTMGTASTYHLYAVWNVEKYSITYQLNKGEVSGNPANFTVLTPTFTLSNPTRPGYTFLGWSGTGIDGTSKAVTVEKGSVGNRTYTANWEANRNTIVFHPNGGTGTMENQTIPTDESQTLTRNGFTKAGYTFVGWAISSDTAVKYQDGASYTMGVEETYHLYAIWTPNQNTLTFDGNGATSGSMDALRKYSDEKFMLPGVGFSKTGYSFKGWSKTPNGTVLVQDGADYTMDCQDQVILYAVWGINQYTITIEANGGKGTTKITQDYNTVVKAPTLTRSGYAFEEWFADADFKTVYNFATMPADNITVYVKWQLSNFGGEQTGIRTPAELDAIRNNLAGNYYLENSIDMDGVDWLPIGNSTEPFTGSFDGKGNVIKNLKITKSNNYYVGLFGYSNSTIRNVHVKNAYYRPSIYTGGITGYGDVENSTWSGEINSGNLKDDSRAWTSYTGGITGWGQATNCSSYGVIEVILYSKDKNLIPQVGGIAGFVNAGGKISGCYSNVSITVNSKQSAQYGVHYGIYYAAGITPAIGNNGTITIINCYTDVPMRLISDSNSGWDDRYGYCSFTTYSASLITTSTLGKANIYYSYDASNFYGNNIKIVLTEAEYQSRTYMLNQGWDEDIWCFGYGKPVFYSDGYIRVVYSNVEGANNDSNPSGFKVGSDGFTLKIPYRAGYTFEGWYTDATFTNKITEVKDLTTTLTVYAKWTANTYTITLNPVGGELTDTTASVRYDSDYRLPVPTLPGYTFAGWYDSTGSTAMAITDADGNSLAIWSFATNGTLYAKWNANRNTLILTDGTNKIVLSGKTAEWIRLPANTFTKVNYEFKGWATIQDGKVEYYNRDLFPMGPKSSYTLYAVWAESAETTDFSDYTPISSAQDFYNIRNNLSGKYYLTCDIDMSGYEWIPIGNSSYDQYTGKDTGKAFSGVFDGNGYTIYNYSPSNAFVVQSQSNSFYGNRRYYMYGVGLFGYNQGTIKNVKVVNANVDVTVAAVNPAGSSYNEFDFYSGIICSMNYGHIENCFAQGTLKVSINLPAKNFENRKDGNWFANAEMGGISWNRGTVKECSAEVCISLVCPSITSYMSVLLGKVVPDTENITSISAQTLEELYAVGYIRYKQSNGYYKYQDAKWHAIVSILSPMEKREGYSFVGWSLSEGGEVSYRVGDEVFIPSDQKSLTLYPVWESSTNKNSLDSNAKLTNLSENMGVVTISCSAWTLSLKYYNWLQNLVKE